MEIEQKDGKISFWFYRLAKNKEEEDEQKKAVVAAVEDIRKMKKISWKKLSMYPLVCALILFFHFYTQKVQQTPEYIEQIRVENFIIEDDIKIIFQEKDNEK